MMKKTLQYDQSAGYWQGQNDFVVVRVPHETMLAAYALCMMHGMSCLRYGEWLSQVDTWLEDGRLQELDGVDVLSPD
jgi:hypothetical protein